MPSPLSTAADALIADADNTDAGTLRTMAHEMMQAYGCTYSAAKSALARAIKRRQGQATTWGGKRDYQPGRPPAQQQENDA